MIRLTQPPIEEDDLQAVREVLASGYLVQGATVTAFEQAVAEYVGTRYAVAVSNCTAALYLSLLALGVEPGDRVAVTTYSWPATANVIALCRAEPVFIDIDPGTYNMDPAALGKVLQQGSVKAILPVHAFGGMANMPRILDLAARYGISVIEDAACALGADLHGRRAGAWGTVGCFSFHPRKVVTTGEGGIITTNDSGLVRTLRILRNHGLDPDALAPDFVAPGYNFRLTEFQAALGLSQMGKIERIIESRRASAAYYDSLLNGTGITPPASLVDSRHVFQSYVILLPHEAAPHRADIIAALKRRGIETTIGTYHIPLTAYFRNQGGFKPGDFPVTDNVAARALSLPMSQSLSRAEQEYVIYALKSLIF